MCIIDYYSSLILQANHLKPSFWWFKSEKLKPGALIGSFMVLVFGSRFFIEFLKNPQSLMIDETFLNAGQYLSIPFIALGVFLLSYKPSSFKTQKKH